MADPFERLVQGQYQAPANNFGPLTPEQEALIRRGVTTETISPADLLFGGGIGAGISRGLTGLAARAIGMELPLWAKIGSMASGGITGANLGGNLPGIRAQQNTMMDAEGQPGGFYGARR